MTFSFVVPGPPVTQGSVKPGITRRGQLYTRHDNGPALLEWREAAQEAIMIARPKASVKRFDKGVPVEVFATFIFPRPKKPTYAYPVKDIDKVSRALLDSLTGVLLVNDSQVVGMHVEKRYGEPAETRVEVRAA